MNDFLLQFRVRYAETDAMGVVHHAVYPVWFEMGRTEFLRAAGMPYRGMEDSGIQSPVTEMHVRYRRPARYDDLVTLAVRVEQYTGTRLRIAYRVLIDDELVCSGESGHAFLYGGRPCALQRCAPDVHAALERIAAEGAPDGPPVSEVTISGFTVAADGTGTPGQRP